MDDMRATEILIVDSDPLIVSAFRKILSLKPDLLPFYATTVPEAFKILFSSSIRCIVLGRKIGRISGTDFRKILREIVPEIPILILEKAADPRSQKRQKKNDVLTLPLKKNTTHKAIDKAIQSSAALKKGVPFTEQIFLSPLYSDDKLIIMRTALDILSHDTKNLFIRILTILSDMPNDDYTGILNDYINELFECISEALGSMGAKKRIDSLIDIVNSIRIGTEKIPLSSHSRIELTYSPRKLLYIETSRLLKNAITNIVDNALKYSAPDRKVRIEIERKTQGLILRVSDNGIGIPKEDRTRVFQRNFRSEGAKAVDGSGIGLWIAHNIVKEEKGEIIIDDNPEGGTVMTLILPPFNLATSGLSLMNISDWFKLPYEVVDKKARIIKTIILLEFPAYAAEADSLAFANLLDHLRDERRKKERQKYFIKLQRYTQFNPQGKTVLLVDDSLYVHYSLAPMLTDRGFRIVDFAFNGVEANNLYQIFTPDLVIMDITMPVKSGIETAKDIFKTNPKAKIIFITALGEYKPLLENIETFFQGKNYRVLSKPLRPQHLHEALESIFSQRP
jgi:signal transduction histidine kinase/ActR/RegA family two-component response regulator